MNVTFDIDGTDFAASEVAMRGNTIEARFAPEAAGRLSAAYKAGGVVASPLMSATYSVQGLRTDGEGCTAVFSINSSTGRVLH